MNGTSDRHLHAGRQFISSLVVLIFLCLLSPTAIAGVQISFVPLGLQAASDKLSAGGTGVGHLQTHIPTPFSGGSVNDLIGADTFYNNGITGQGTVTANVEAGHIWSGHESVPHVSQFSHGVTAWDDPGTVGNQQSDLYDRHATWVGMHIGGRNGGASPGSHQTGIAPGTDLKSGAVSSEWNGNAYSLGFNFNVDSFLTPYATYFGSADVINSSWGGEDTFGINDFAIALDGFADQFPNTTFVTSAGNSSDPDNNPNTPPEANTVGWPGSGYNSVTVAALQNNGNNVYDAVADFSSRGPQAWGFVDLSNGNLMGCFECRAAVDIAAPGTNLTAAYYGGPTGGNNPALDNSPSGGAGGPDFYSFSVAGTSFAAPITAGAAALLDSASYNTPALAGNADSRDARVVKAVLQNSAEKIPGWENGQVTHPNGNGGVLTAQSLDWNSGAGALDLEQAYEQYVEAGTRDVPGTATGNQGFVDRNGWDFGHAEEGPDNIYLINEPLLAGRMMTVTLTWFRDRDIDLNVLSIDEVAQADLDLTIRDTVTGSVISQSFSGVNNVEHLHFALPRTSLYQIEVDFFGAVFDFYGTMTGEDYGLAWSVVPEPWSGALLLIEIACISGSGRKSARCGNHMCTLRGGRDERRGGNAG